MSQFGCAIHNNSPLTTIQKSIDKVQLLCDQCVLECEKESLKTCFSIKKAIKYPDYFYSKITTSKEFNLIFSKLSRHTDSELKSQLDDIIEHIIEPIRKGLAEIEKQFRDSQNFFMKKRHDFQEELKQLIKFKSFEEIFDQLEKLNNDKKDISEIEQQLLDAINVVNEEERKVFSLTNESIKKSLKDLKLEQQKEFTYECQGQFFASIEALKQKHCDFYNSLFPDIQFCFTSSLLPYQLFQDKIITTIAQEAGVSKVSAILNNRLLPIPDFWQKIAQSYNNDKLLMIFKTTNGSVFGGYIQDLKAQINQGNYDFRYLVQNATKEYWFGDDRSYSFLFSFTNNEIYRLKKVEQKFAFYLHKGNGPIFGQGYDLFIDENFSAKSTLGHSYSCNKGISKTHLLNTEQAEITNLEIFSIKFEQ